MGNGFVSSVSIEPLNSNRTYNAGDILVGKIVLRNLTPMKVKKITVYLEGVGKTHWSEVESYTEDSTEVVDGKTVTLSRTKSRTVHFNGKETYISKYQYLVNVGSPSLSLDEGTYYYPFRFQLPENLPTTFNGEYGSVSYCLSVRVKPSSRFDLDIWEDIPIRVNGKFDLNLKPFANQSGSGAVEMIPEVNFCECNCNDGSVRFTLKLPQKSGFIPGEVLEFHIEIFNDSNKRIVEIKTSLIQRLTFHAEQKEKESKNIIATVKGCEIEKKEHKAWTSTALKIPGNLPPTGLGGMGTCKVIEVEYSLQMEMRVEGSETLITGELPISVGTVPLNISTTASASTSGVGRS